MRVLIDYRSALRGRSGVGEYAYQMARSLVACAGRSVDHPTAITLFSSSWKDRLSTSETSGAASVDLRVPVALLNFAWHRLGWPPAEMLTRASFDVVHSLHPLLMPARRAAQVVTIHDLNFLTHPERTRAEIRRDYPRIDARTCAPSRPHHRAIAFHGRRSRATSAGARGITSPSARPGAPDWEPRALPPCGGYILFLGTLEPRKNVGTLLDAYERLIAASDGGCVDVGPRVPSNGPGAVPDLVLAGGVTFESQRWLDRIARAPLARPRSPYRLRGSGRSPARL